MVDQLDGLHLAMNAPLDLPTDPRTPGALPAPDLMVPFSQFYDPRWMAQQRRYAVSGLAAGAAVVANELRTFPVRGVVWANPTAGAFYVLCSDGTVLTIPPTSYGAMPLPEPVERVTVSVRDAPGATAYTLDLLYCEAPVLPAIGIVGSAGGGGASDVTVHDPTTVTQKLAVDAAGRIGVNNFPATQPVSGAVSVSNFPSGFNVNNTPGVVADTRGAASWATSQVNVTTAGGSLLAARATRQSVLVENQDAANPIFVSSNAAPSATNGVKIAAGSSLVFNHQLQLYAISTGATVIAGISEEWT